MKKTVCGYLRIIIIISLSMELFGQEFAIRKVELTADKIILHYDLIDTTRGHQYTMRLYSSRDSYTAPLQKVIGDVGLEVKPGLNKQMVWSAREELGATFAGEMELEIRGRVYIPFIRFEGFEDIKKIKRHQPRVITWTGGSRQNVLNFDLYNKEGLSVWTKSGVANDPHELELILPVNIKPGKGYYFRVSDSKNKDQEVKTSEFEVRRKIPLIAKLAPMAAIGAFLVIDPLGLFKNPPFKVQEPPALPD